MSEAPRRNCCVCGSGAVAARHRTREMMFGLREPFDYTECGGCGSLQISDVPADLARHYPSGYYSLRPAVVPRGLRGAIRRIRNGYALTGRGLLGRALHAVFPYPVRGAHRWVRRMGLDRSARILDVGCGAGDLLKDLGQAGFRHLLGADPFVTTDLDLGDGVSVLKRTLEEVEGEFDLVMFHHALEHTASPAAVLRAAAARLRPGGWCLVRVPTVTGEAWERYGPDWVQLDPPRHLFVPSARGMETLAERTGFHLEAIEYDSTELQFVGSELYRRDIPLNDANGQFSRAQLRRFRRNARRLNRAARGDQAAFYLRRC